MTDEQKQEQDKARVYEVSREANNALTDASGKLQEAAIEYALRRKAAELAFDNYKRFLLDRHDLSLQLKEGE